jgi:predicted alpha/beta hydrolase family esterase
MDFSTLGRVTFGVAAAVLIAIVVYVVVSFAFMVPHTERRAKRKTLRAAFTEVFWAVLTQPLLPLFYFFGHRMGGPDEGVPVVLVHGYMQNRVDFLRIARALARAKVGPIYGFNYPWMASVGGNAKRLHRYIERVCKAHNAPQVDLICHSLGGLVALEYMSLTSAEPRVRRCATIASPHAGIAWKGPIPGACAVEMRSGCVYLAERAGHKVPVPCLSISSTHDNVVHPHATSALAHRGGHDVIVPDVAHLTILFTPYVVDAIVRWEQGAV